MERIKAYGSRKSAGNSPDSADFRTPAIRLDKFWYYEYSLESCLEVAKTHSELNIFALF